jgi:hypothetical protein
MRNCLTGQTFRRRAGKLPARWIVNSFLKIVSLLAPHLEVTLGVRIDAVESIDYVFSLGSRVNQSFAIFELG